jgi:hypothetical protein
MTVGAADVALCHLCDNQRQGNALRSHFHQVTQLGSAYMVKVQNDRIGLRTVYAGMFWEVTP